MAFIHLLSIQLTISILINLNKFTSSFVLPPSKKLQTNKYMSILPNNDINRRDLAREFFNALSSIAFFRLVTMADHAMAAEKGLLSIEDVAKKLHVIPTFTIVDPNGVPYMVFGEDAKLTAYFFLTYPEAKRILQLAKTSSDTWNEARISTVPLDFALTLETKSTKGSYFVVSPADEDLEEATSLQPNFETLEEGRNIPLFYYANFKTKDKFPMYFRKADLMDAFKKEYPDLPFPKVRVTEFVSVLTDLVSPKSKTSGLSVKELKIVSFEYPLDSLEYAKQCNLDGKEAFKIGERIVVL